MKKKKLTRFNKIILLLPLALVLGFLSYLGAAKLINQVSQNKELKSWQVYKNEAYGFRLNYPPGFFYDLQPNDPTAKPPILFDVSFIENKYSLKDIHYPALGVLVIKTDLSPQNFLAKNATSESVFDSRGDYLYYGVAGITTVKVSGREALQFESSAVSSYSKHTFIPGDGILIDIVKGSTGIGEIPEEIYLQMLSSFKFI